MIPQIATEVKENLEDVTVDSVSSPTSLVSYRHISESDSRGSIYRALVDAGECAKGESFMSCGQEVYTLKCESCGYEHTVTYNCKLRFCSHCAGVKMSGYMNKYLPYLDSLEPYSVRSVMLSMKNVDDLRAGVDKIRKDFNTLRNREYYKSRIEGGLYGIEAKPGHDGKWNIHLHFIFLGSYLPQGKLSEDWLDVTGNSFYVWINHAPRPADSLRYILKYITKGIQPGDDEWTGENLVEFVVALSDVRMIQAFGCFLGEVSDKEPFDCPKCGYRLWRRLDAEGETVYSPLEIMLWKVRNGRSP